MESHVFALGHHRKILQAIVGFDPVDVVQNVPSGYRPVCCFPHDSMFVLTSSLRKLHADVALLAHPLATLPVRSILATMSASGTLARAKLRRAICNQIWIRGEDSSAVKTFAINALSPRCAPTRIGAEHNAVILGVKLDTALCADNRREARILAGHRSLQSADAMPVDALPRPRLFIGCKPDFTTLKVA